MIENRSIKDITTSEVISVHENQNLSEVTAIFRENSIHHIPVLKGTKPVGIISAQDIFKLIFDMDSTDQRMLDVLLDNTYKLSEVMTTNLVILDEETATVEDVARLLSDSSFHSIIVVDHKGDLSGIVTTTDLVRFLHDNIETED